jgi:hypothetical protein
MLFNYSLGRQFLDVAAHYFSAIVAPQQTPPVHQKPTKLVCAGVNGKPMIVSPSLVMFRLRRRDWIVLSAFIVAGAVGSWLYNKWAEEGLRRTEADMKSNLPLRVDPRAFSTNESS